MKIGVIADDLTGALDTGLEFWKKGLKTVVVTSALGLKRHARSADVVVADTASRTSKPRQARAKVASATRLLRKEGARLFYKKIDSTLRGNIGAELEGVMDELGIETTILAPALPEQGRTTVDGHVLLDGKRLEKTAFSKDPLCPMSQSHIPTLVKEQTRKKVGWISLSFVRRGNLKDEMENLRTKGTRIIVVDAVTRRDLRVIAESMAEIGIATLSCGSAGLAAELPVALGFCQRLLPIVLLSGSLNPVTQTQIRRISETLDVDVVGVSLSSLSNRDAQSDLMKMIHKSITNGEDTVVFLHRNGRDGLNSRKAHEALSWLRSIVGAVAEKKIGGLVLVGGETAALACRSLRAEAMLIEDESDLGLACARILDGKSKGMRIVTKAGGFGDEYALAKAINFLKLRRP